MSDRVLVAEVLRVDNQAESKGVRIDHSKSRVAELRNGVVELEHSMHTRRTFARSNAASEADVRHEARLLLDGVSCAGKSTSESTLTSSSHRIE